MNNHIDHLRQDIGVVIDALTHIQHELGLMVSES